jgi:hypothetical protein
MPLIIKKEHENPAHLFTELACGEIFLFNNKLFMKVKVVPPNDDPYFCAIDFENGKEDFELSEDRYVVPVKATLTYYINSRD